MISVNTVPPRFLPARPASLDTDVLGQITAWLPTGETLLFAGPTGGGKSWAASIAARLWRQAKKEARVEGGYFSDPCEFQWAEVPALAGELRNLDRSEGVVDTCMAAPLLVLDDLGAEKGSEFLVERIYTIINHRYAWEKPTIVTTNLDLEQMGALWPRMASRLCSGTIVALAGADRRMAQGVQ